jgi:amidohydrolase
MDIDKNSLKRVVWEAIDEKRSKILALTSEIFSHPELGYKEYKTAAVVKGYLDGLGLKVRDRIALTGLRSDVPGRTDNARIGLMCELDAVICFEHPAANKLTGAAHACGHHIQIGAALGALTGLMGASALNHLDGSVSILVVPAEEPVELDYRTSLLREGKIQFPGGKQEFLRLGEFDDIDAVLMVHADSEPPVSRKALLTTSSNGFLIKRVTFIGREAHAGVFPWDGINALNACLMGLLGIHVQRETFREEDTVRVHPIITHGGDAVNIVPANVRMETYVRAATIEAMNDANTKVNRALRAGALCVGGQCEIDNIPGYLPFMADSGLNRIYGENVRILCGDDSVVEGYHLPGSTDAGNISQFRPTIHPMVGGVQGKVHTRHFTIIDPETAILIPAKALAGSVVDLLFDGAKQAKMIRSTFQPRFSTNDFINLWGKLSEEQ